MTARAGAISTRPAATSAEAGRVPTAARPHERLHLFGIRHHGPGSARSLVTALDELGPDAVLVELPADTEPLLRWVVDDGLVPPVALLGYLPADVSRAAFWPLAEFSPEWQAIRWAYRHGIAPVPIDIPDELVVAAGAARRSGRRVHGRPARGARAGGGGAGSRAMVGGRGRTPRRRRAGVRGCRRGDGGGAGTRADGSATRRGASGNPTCAGRYAPPLAEGGGVAVVCGAWHVPALDPWPHDGGRRRGIAAGCRPRHAKTAVTWVPWSDHRLQRRSGYAAGVSHPGWYRHVFRHPGRRGRQLLRRRRRGAARRGSRGIPRPPHRGVPPRRRAGRRSAIGRGPAWARCSTPPAR